VSVRKPKVSVRKTEVSGEIFELETSVKVVIPNVSVAETRNFESLWIALFVNQLQHLHTKILENRELPEEFF
jgi:hypothetical protein